MQEWYKGVMFREVSSVQECPVHTKQVPLLCLHFACVEVYSALCM